MKTVYTLIFVIALACFNVNTVQSKEKNKGHTVLAELTRIEAGSISFTKPRKEDKSKFTVTIKEDTVIEINGEKAILADLKPGMKVIIDINEKDKTAYSVTFTEKKNDKKK